METNKTVRKYATIPNQFVFVDIQSIITFIYYLFNCNHIEWIISLTISSHLSFISLAFSRFYLGLISSLPRSHFSFSLSLFFSPYCSLILVSFHHCFSLISLFLSLSFTPFLFLYLSLISSLPRSHFSFSISLSFSLSLSFTPFLFLYLSPISSLPRSHFSFSISLFFSLSLFHSLSLSLP